MAMASDTHSEELFVYSWEEHQLVSFRQRLEQERAARGISQSLWARHLIIGNHDLRPLDPRYDPLPIDFPVHAFLQDLDNLMQHRGAQSSLPVSDSPPTLQAQVSDPMGIEIIVIRVGRSTNKLREALTRNDELRDNIVEIQDGQGQAGAKLVARPEHRVRIMTYLITHGAPVQGETLRLPQMKPRHIIVEDQFQTRVGRIIASLPCSEVIRPRPIANIRVPFQDLDLTQAASISADESANLPHTLPDNVLNRAPQTGYRSHPYPRPALQSTSRRISSPSFAPYGERPLAHCCSICQATFPIEDHLLRHMLSFHGDGAAAETLTAGSSSVHGVCPPLLAAHVSSMVNINDASRQPNQDAASLLYDDKDCPPTQVDEDGDEHEVEGVQEVHMVKGRQSLQDNNARQVQDINSRESRSIVIARTFVHIPVAAVSEGQQTASTGERIGVNPRRARRHEEDSQSTIPSTMSSLSLRRLQLDSQE